MLQEVACEVYSHSYSMQRRLHASVFAHTCDVLAIQYLIAKKLADIQTGTILIRILSLKSRIFGFPYIFKCVEQRSEFSHRNVVLLTARPFLASFPGTRRVS